VPTEVTALRVSASRSAVHWLGVPLYATVRTTACACPSFCRIFLVAFLFFTFFSQGTRIAGWQQGRSTQQRCHQDGALVRVGLGAVRQPGARGDRGRHGIVPERVTAVAAERMTQIACGWRHSVVVNSAGKVFSFGWSKYGQLGHGDNVGPPHTPQIQSVADKTIVQVRPRNCHL